MIRIQMILLPWREVQARRRKRRRNEVPPSPTPSPKAADSQALLLASTTLSPNLERLVCRSLSKITTSVLWSHPMLYPRLHFNWVQRSQQSRWILGKAAHHLVGWNDTCRTLRSQLGDNQVDETSLQSSVGQGMGDHTNPDADTPWSPGPSWLSSVDQTANALQQIDRAYVEVSAVQVCPFPSYLTLPPNSPRSMGQKPTLDMSDFCHSDIRSDDWLPTLSLTSDDPQHPSSDRAFSHFSPAPGLDPNQPTDQPTPPTGLGLDSDQPSSPTGLRLDSDPSSQIHPGTQHLGLDSSDPAVASQNVEGSVGIGLNSDLYGCEDGSDNTLMGVDPLYNDERIPQNSSPPLVWGIDSGGSDDWSEVGQSGGDVPCENAKPWPDSQLSNLWDHGGQLQRNMADPLSDGMQSPTEDDEHMSYGPVPCSSPTSAAASLDRMEDEAY